VTWLNGTPMALAFRGSMLTYNCGSFEVKVVFMPVRPEAGGAALTTRVWACGRCRRRCYGRSPAG